MANDQCNAAAPRIYIPGSDSTVSVSVIDSARLLSLPWNLFIGPSLDSIEGWNCSGYSFLVTHTDLKTGAQRRLLFDLAPAADWETTLPPPQHPLLKGWQDGGAKFVIEEQIFDVLKKHGVELTGQDAMLWSHPHWDHIGKPALFSTDVPLLVGPGVLQTFGPGYPEVENAPWYTKDMQGRCMREVSFSQPDAVIGGLRALDYFGDGSFYLLDAPGHCVGHMNALARVQADSFIYMGADSYHHPSQIRPNQNTPLPKDVAIGAPLPASFLPSPCPGDIFQPLYTNIDKHKHNKHYADFCAHTKPGHTAMLTLGFREDGYCVSPDPPTCLDTISKIQNFDGDERVFCISSHDIALADILDFFPKAADGWRAAGWREQGRWNHLRDFEPFLKKHSEEGAVP